MHIATLQKILLENILCFVVVVLHPHINVIFAYCCSGKQRTSLGIQRCVPMLQPFWSRKALKSKVWIQQQLQDLYLGETGEHQRPVALNHALLSPSLVHLLQVRCLPNSVNSVQCELPLVEDGRSGVMCADLRVRLRPLVRLESNRMM